MDAHTPRYFFLSATFFFLLAAIFFLLAIASIAQAQDVPATHIRPLMTGVDRFVAEGIARSPTIRALAERLDASDVVVYVRTRPFTSPLTKGHLLFITAAGGRRYVLVEIACGESWNTQLAMLGHELRHAVEIAEAPWITSDADLAAHYSRIGMETVMAASHESFETVAAADAGRRVARELTTQASTLNREP